MYSWQKVKIMASSQHFSTLLHLSVLIFSCYCKAIQERKFSYKSRLPWQIQMWNDNIPSLLCQGQITLSKIDEICPLAIQNQISTISMHIPSLVRIHWLFLVIIWKRKYGCVLGKFKNLPISNRKSDLHNINADTKSGEN